MGKNLLILLFLATTIGFGVLYAIQSSEMEELKKLSGKHESTAIEMQRTAEKAQMEAERQKRSADEARLKAEEILQDCINKK